MTPELLKLIDDYGDASFDCGEWEGDLDDEPSYETVFAAQQAARQALLQEVERLQAELATLMAVAHKHGWNGVENSKILSQFLDDQLEELEQAKSSQSHCLACGGVECHRLAEIVKLTGMETDQHLVELVKQAEVMLQEARDGWKGALSVIDQRTAELTEAKERLHSATTQLQNLTVESLHVAKELDEAKEQAKEQEKYIEEANQMIQEAAIETMGLESKLSEAKERERWSSVRLFIEAEKAKDLEAANARLREALTFVTIADSLGSAQVVAGRVLREAILTVPPAPVRRTEEERERDKAEMRKVSLEGLGLTIPPAKEKP